MSSDLAPASNGTDGGTRKRRMPSPAGLAGLVFLFLIVAICLGTLPWTLGAQPGQVTARYNAGSAREGRLPPSWWPARAAEARRINALVDSESVRKIADAHSISPDEARAQTHGQVAQELRRASPVGRAPLRYLLGTDVLGRSLFYRCLAGGGISLVIGILAAVLSVVIGTVYGMVAGYAGGRLDAVMMRVVDVLYGLPYVLLVVLLAVAVDSALDRLMAARAQAALEERTAHVQRGVDAAPGKEASPTLKARLSDEALARYGTGEIPLAAQNAVNIVTLLVAIGGVSWLTMARVVRGQVLSLKNQPFIEAARAVGASGGRIFARHLLPNLVGPIVVYATLTVPQAILQESFLSFLGIGVKPPVPSWGNLASEGLAELNPYQSNWWLLLFPCLLLSLTLLALNLVGEGLREALDPKRSRL